MKTIDELFNDYCNKVHLYGPIKERENIKKQCLKSFNFKKYVLKIRWQELKQELKNCLKLK